MEERPRTNVAQGNAENFKVEQERFLLAQMQFKSGVLFYGIVAAGLLTSMFYILPAGRQFSKDRQTGTDIGQGFVDACDAFRLEVFKYGRKKGIDSLTMEQQFPLNADYAELDNQYDALVRQFYLIMYETGFSP